jgi:phage FluMu gp28-like protein
VLCIVKVLRGIADVVHVEVMKRTDSDGLEAMVAWAFKRYRLRRLCIDSTGLGTFPAERMKKKHGDRIDVPHKRNKVELINFTANSKEELATNLFTVMTSQEVRLPDDDAQLPAFERWDEDEKGNRVGNPRRVNEPETAKLLRKEIASIRRIVTPSGNVSYDAPRTKDGHADRAWGLALALFACDKVHPMVMALQARMRGGG